MEYVTVKLELDSSFSDRSYMYSRSQPSLRIPRFPLVHLSSLRRFELNLELIAYTEQVPLFLYDVRLEVSRLELLLCHTISFM